MASEDSLKCESYSDDQVSDEELKKQVEEELANQEKIINELMRSDLSNMRIHTFECYLARARIRKPLANRLF